MSEINSVISSGLESIRSGLDRANKASSKIVYSAETADISGLAESFMELNSAKNQVAVGSKLIKVGDQMLGSLLDILG